jgi:acetyltransferase
LFDTLSPNSIYLRFFTPLKSLSHDMLARFTQIDYDRDVALVALQRHAGGERMLAVARLMGDPDVTRAEFSIVVGDPWQGKGIGAVLLERLIAIAKERDMSFLWGIVLSENTGMLALGRKLGFQVCRVPFSDDFELRINLKPGVFDMACLPPPGELH